MANGDSALITFLATFAGVFVSFLLWLIGERWLKRRSENKDCKMMYKEVCEEAQYNATILKSQIENTKQIVDECGDVPLYLPRLRKTATTYAITSGNVRYLKSREKQLTLYYLHTLYETHNDFNDNTEQVFAILLLRPNSGELVKYRLERYIEHVKEVYTALNNLLKKFQNKVSPEGAEVKDKAESKDSEPHIEQTEAKEKKKINWWKELAPPLLMSAGQLFFGIVLTGMVLYLVAKYKQGDFEPFALATVAGLLGGFPLVTSFGEKVEERIKKQLRWVGGLYFFAAILFVVFGFYQAADQAQLIPKDGEWVWAFVVIYNVTFYGAAIALIGGMWGTLIILPRLVGLGDVFDGFKRIFMKRNKK